MEEEQAIPVLFSSDAESLTRWYARLGFEKEWEHRFGPDFPRFVSIRRGVVRLFLSEHAGDAVPGGLIYIRVTDVDAVAAVLGSAAEDMPWGAREVHAADPDGNRLRFGQSLG